MSKAILEILRQQVAAIERAGWIGAGRLDGQAGLLAANGGASAPAVRFGVEAVDGHLPWGGLPGACLHEVNDGWAPPAGFSRRCTSGSATGFTAALVARISARRNHPVVWITLQETLHAPGLMGFGLAAENLVAVTARDNDEALWAMEECLRADCVGAVVGEIPRVDLKASRRLQLAAEAGGSLGVLLLPAPAQDDDGEIPLAPSAAVTRWHVGAAPSAPPLGMEKLVGATRWQTRLLRCRGGTPRSWCLEWCCETRGFALATPLSDRPVVPARGAGAAVLIGEGSRALAG
ncbi:MAG: ImuA family protein [Alphaproteobacteria bacterium]